MIYSAIMYAIHCVPGEGAMHHVQSMSHVMLSCPFVFVKSCKRVKSFSVHLFFKNYFSHLRVLFFSLSF